MLLLGAKSCTSTLHSARFDTRWTVASIAVVSAYGDIDASNANALTDYALLNAAHCGALILDFSDVEFFGTEGFSALHRVSVGCAHGELGWMIIPGVAVSRLLRICDPHGSLPTADSVDAALASLGDTGI